MIWSRTRRTTLVTNRANARTWMLTGCNSNKCSSTRTDQNTQRSLCVCVILRRKQAGRQYATRARWRWAGSLSPFALNAGGVRRLKRSRTHVPITTEQNFTLHYKYLSFVCVFRRTTPWWLSDAFVLICLMWPATGDGAALKLIEFAEWAYIFCVLMAGENAPAGRSFSERERARVCVRERVHLYIFPENVCRIIMICGEWNDSQGWRCMHNGDVCGQGWEAEVKNLILLYLYLRLKAHSIGLLTSHWFQKYTTSSR